MPGDPYSCAVTESSPITVYLVYRGRFDLMRIDEALRRMGVITYLHISAAVGMPLLFGTRVRAGFPPQPEPNVSIVVFAQNKFMHT